MTQFHSLDRTQGNAAALGAIAEVGEAAARCGPGRLPSTAQGSAVRRRDLLRGIGAGGAAAALAIVAKPVAASADGGGGFGAYFITVASSSSTQPMFKGVLALAAGGVAINVSSVPRGTHLGAWELTGDNSIQLRLIAFQFDGSGHYIGYVQVDASGPVPYSSISGKYTVTFFPAGGGSQVVDQGTLSGNRLPA